MATTLSFEDWLRGNPQWIGQPYVMQRAQYDIYRTQTAAGDAGFPSRPPATTEDKDTKGAPFTPVTLYDMDGNTMVANSEAIYTSALSNGWRETPPAGGGGIDRTGMADYGGLGEYFGEYPEAGWIRKLQESGLYGSGPVQQWMKKQGGRAYLQHQMQEIMKGKSMGDYTYFSDAPSQLGQYNPTFKEYLNYRSPVTDWEDYIASDKGVSATAQMGVQALPPWMRQWGKYDADWENRWRAQPEGATDFRSWLASRLGY